MKKLHRSILLSQHHMRQLFHCMKYTMPCHKAPYEDTREGVCSLSGCVKFSGNAVLFMLNIALPSKHGHFQILSVREVFK